MIVLTPSIQLFPNNGRHLKILRFYSPFVLMNSPSLVKSMTKSFGIPFVMAAFLKLIHDICQFVGPFMLPRIISFLEDTDAPRVLL